MVLPKGHKGVLRFAHTYKVNRLLEFAFSRARGANPVFMDAYDLYTYQDPKQ